MGFSSIDDLVNEITTNSKFFRSVFQKISTNAAASVAGRWHGTFSWTGVPATGGFTGSAGVATVMNKTTSGALFINADVSTDTRHLLNMGVFTPTTTICPATLILCDFLLYYPACVVTGTPTTLNNTATLPRYTDGAGVFCFIEVQTVLGAASPALTLTFVDQADQSRTGILTSPANSAPVSTCFASSGGVWLPFGVGTTTGIKSITSYTLASGTTGTVAFVLAKPLATPMPLLALNVASERDYLVQLPSLPRVLDGACLGFVMLVGGAMITSAILCGTIDMGWG